MQAEGNIVMFEPKYDLEKIRTLESALLEYVERYGLTDSAKAALEQLEDIQVSSTGFLVRRVKAKFGKKRG